MLFRRLASALTSGLAIGVSASPLVNSDRDDAAVNKRVVPATHTLHERQMKHWGRSWEKREKLPARALLPMRVGLMQRNIELGARYLQDISDPTSSNYGKHMSADEVIDMFAPPQSSIDAVTEWLVAFGIPATSISLSANKQWLQFDTHAEEVEQLLYTEFFLYEHIASGSKSIAVDEYHLPLEIRPHIDYVTPGVKMRADTGKLRKLKRRQKAEQSKRVRRREDLEKLRERGFKAQWTGLTPIVDDNGHATGPPALNASVCDTYVSIECIRTQYSVPNNTLAAPGNELGIFESLNDHYSKADLDTFFSALFPCIPNGTYPIEKLIDGAIGSVEDVGYPQEDAGVESDLDFESSMPLIFPQTTVLFQTDDQFIEVNQTSASTPYLGFYNTFFDAIDGSYCSYSAYGETGNCVDPECLDPAYPDPNKSGFKGQLMCGVYKPTNVISISYGGGEADLPAYYLKRQCNEIMKLGLQGTTVVMSSGDYGVGSYPGDFGLETGCAGPNAEVFYPDADATCPYVLAVGSTQFNFVNKNATGNGSTAIYESATARFASGGGFSNYFDTPNWQKSAVSDYFDEVDLDFAGYYKAGTNFSDVGAGVYRIGGRGYPDVSAIGDYFVLFTEGVWASVGGTSLSSPVFASVLTIINEHRIAAGKSTVGFIHPTIYAHPEVFTDITEGSNPNCGTTGFLASKGWDPVTGLGTPVYPKLLELFLSLP